MTGIETRAAISNAAPYQKVAPPRADASPNPTLGPAAAAERARAVVDVETVEELLTEERLRIRVGVSASNPVVSSVTEVFPGANFYEREAYDLFGIVFDGHPDLTRIVLPDDWEGHPLRKDYSVGSVPVRFKESPKAQ